MPDFAKQAHTALAIYLSRGQQALLLLEKNEFAAADKFLRLRKAAFHNFRAADALAQQAPGGASGSTAQRDPDAAAAYADLARAAITLDEELMRALEKKKAQAEQAAVNLNSQRAKLHKFRSADAPGASFQKSV